MKANTVYARAQAAILRSSGHSVKYIAKLLKKTERWVNKWSKRKSFEDKPRSGRPSVLTNHARNVIETAKYKRNNSTRKIAKYLQRHHINVSNTPNSRQRIGRTSCLQMSVLSIYFNTRIQNTTSYGDLRSATFPRHTR